MPRVGHVDFSRQIEMKTEDIQHYPCEDSKDKRVGKEKHQDQDSVFKTPSYMGAGHGGEDPGNKSIQCLSH